MKILLLYSNKPISQYNPITHIHVVTLISSHSQRMTKEGKKTSKDIFVLRDSERSVDSDRFRPSHRSSETRHSNGASAEGKRSRDRSSERYLYHLLIINNATISLILPSFYKWIIFLEYTRIGKLIPHICNSSK